METAARARAWLCLAANLGEAKFVGSSWLKKPTTPAGGVAVVSVSVAKADVFFKSGSQDTMSGAVVSMDDDGWPPLPLFCDDNNFPFFAAAASVVVQTVSLSTSLLLSRPVREVLFQEFLLTGWELTWLLQVADWSWTRGGGYVGGGGIMSNMLGPSLLVEVDTRESLLGQLR